MSHFNNGPGNGDIFFIGLVGSVDHHRGKTVANTLNRQLIGVAVVEMQRNGYGGFAGDFSRDHRHVVQLAVLDLERADLQDRRQLEFLGGFHHRLYRFEIPDLEGANRIFVLPGLEHYIQHRRQTHAVSPNMCVYCDREYQKPPGHRRIFSAGACAGNALQSKS